MTVTAELADGRRLEFPDGTKPEVVQSTVKKLLATQTPPSSGGFLNAAKETIGNIPSSAGRFASGIGTAIAHPIDTAKTALNIGAGALQAGFAPESWKTSGNPDLYDPQAAKQWEAAKGFYKQRYGGLSNIGQTIRHDPVGVAADVAGVLMPAAKLGGIADAAGLPKVAAAANAVGKVGEALNPVGAAFKAAKAVSPVGKNLYQYAAAMATGSGKTAIEEAAKGTPEFIKAMRGNLDDAQVLNMAREGVSSLKADRAAAYTKQLRNLEGSTQKLSLDPIKVKMDSILKQFNVGKNPDGSLDFTRSALSEGAKDIQGMYNDVNSWGTHAGDNTPVMLDILKRRIADRYSDSGQARAAVTDMSNFIKGRIVSAVPDYAKMSADYAKSSETIDLINKALSTGDRASADTAMRKIIQSIKEERPNRRAYLEQLGNQSGNNVLAAAAGRTMAPGWSGRLGPIAHFYGTSAVAAYLHNPFLIALLPLASPRLTGEFTVAAGKALRAVSTDAERAKMPMMYGGITANTQQQ